MLRVKFIVVASYILFIVCSVFWVRPVLCYTDVEAKEVIEVAEGEVLSCYNAVFEAEKAGANVSELLVVLNDAGGLLSKAKLAYDYGDFNSAFTYAEECISRLEGFLGQADSLRLEAEQAAYYDFMVNFVGSGVGGLGVVVGGFVIWKFLKKREETEERV